MALLGLQFLSQVKVLSKKNLVLLVTRHWLSTLLQAIVGPILILALTLNIKNFTPKFQGFGIGSPAPIRSIQESIQDSQHLVLVRPRYVGPDVDRVIDTIKRPLAPHQVTVVESKAEASANCPTSWRGVSYCYAVISFVDSPLTKAGQSIPDQQGSNYDVQRYPDDAQTNNTWSYSLRFDPARGSYGGGVFTKDNSMDIYYLPTQLAVENAISNSTVLPQAYQFTLQTQEMMDAYARIQYGQLVIRTYVIIFFLSIIPCVYHVVGVITRERESGLSQLIDAMGGSPSARVLSHVISFSVLYFPSWLVMGCLYWSLLLRESNTAIPIFWQIFSGLAVLNASIFAASFFSRRHISSIFTVVCFLCLGGGAAILLNRDVQTDTVLALSFLFPAMNYIFTISHMAIFALGLIPVNLNTTKIEYVIREEGMFEQTYFVAIWTLWVFLIIQIIVYPVLAILAERWIHGLNFKNRTMAPITDENLAAIQTSGLGMVYQPSWYKKLLCCGRNQGFTALKGVGLVAQKNQILCLLGVNGAGKSTALDLLSGFLAPTTGEMVINAGHSQLGICPQKNVLFDRLTVLEHVMFWSQVKGGKEGKAALHQLIESCDLTMKTHSRASTLSGGQKRKLQLACMFAGGTTVCLMDEVTSGLDPISRRVIWNIILAERSKRSLVFTTHFLDEGEVLADHIIILSKGQIKCQGTGTELKNEFGGGYRVHLPKEADVAGIDAPRTVHQDRVIYRTHDSRSAAALVARIETAGCYEAQIAGPTVEDVFLRVAEDDVSATDTDSSSSEPTKTGDDMESAVARRQLSSGKPTSFFQQVRILMMKRFRILPRYWPGAFLALALPIACIPPINDFMSDKFERPSCGNSYIELWPSPVQIYAQSNAGIEGYSSWQGFGVPFGPASASANDTLFKVMDTYPIADTSFNTTVYKDYFKMVDSFEDFQEAIRDIKTGNILGGVWAGEMPTIAVLSGGSTNPAFALANLYTSFARQVKTQVTYEQSWVRGLSGSVPLDGLTYVLYAAFIMAVYPAFFALYPAFEKSTGVRAVQFSNGVRTLPLWTSYFLFDLCFVLAVSIAFTVTISQQFPFWWGQAYMFPVCMFHGMVSILIAYIISTKVSSQLSSFLWTLGYNILSFFVMALAIMLPAVLSDPLVAQRNSDVVSYILGLLFPIGNVLRGLALGVNLFRIACRDDGSVATPASWWGYGFPITYLIIQLFGSGTLLVWLDSDLSFSLLFARFTRNSGRASVTERDFVVAATAGVEKEAARVKESEQDLLRMVNVSKSFNGIPAVSNISLGLGEGEILALLGPNGAGKTTVVNLVRGELRPEHGEIYLRDVDVLRHPRLAQRAIGVCPQFDALDLLTAKQHLEFYARIKGIKDVEANVEAVMARVGLTSFAKRLGSKLSGGNKRKLSLGIALMGNPDVLILDEPSSSMDAAAKRRMWKMLEEIAPGRSLLLTTHSMEEADHLATRAAILSQNLLAIGTTQQLREEYSDLYHVQLVLASAPQSGVEEMGRVEEWVRREFVDVTFEGASLGGQVKFMVPAGAGFTITDGKKVDGAVERRSGKERGVGYLIELLERNREELGLKDYSVGAPTLEKVFLSVVKDNYVDEDEERERRGGGGGGLLRMIFGRG